MYRDHIRAFFNTIQLHRMLLRTDNDVSDPSAIATIQICYSATMRVLEEAGKLGRLNILYYLWDTAHLMIAYSAMLLLKILKQAPDCPGISVVKALHVFNEVADVHTMAAGSLGSQGMVHLERRGPRRAENSVDAQARLLRAIVSRIRNELLPASEQYLEESSNSIDAAILVTQGEGWGISPSDLHQNQLFLPTDPAMFTIPEPIDTTMGNIPGLNAYGMTDLTAGLDYSVESNLIDDRYNDLGLMSWNEPGIFRDAM